MEPSAATEIHLGPARPGGLASRIGRRWRILAVVAVVIAVVAAVMLAGGHRPSMGLTGSGAGVASVAFSPDSKIIAAADEDGFIYLWQTASGQRVITLRSPGDAAVDAIAFSPDGQLLAAGGSRGGRTYLWSTATGRRIATLPGHANGLARSAAFSPDGRTLAVIEGIGDGN